MTAPMSGAPIAPAEQIAQAFAGVTANQEQAAPTQQQAAAGADEGTEFTPEYVQRLRQENAAHRQRAALIDGIAPADLNALAPLLEALRTGDTDTIDEWAAGLYESRGIAERYAAAQGQAAPTQQQAAAGAATQAAVTEAAAQGVTLTPEQVRQMFREELSQVEQGWRQEQSRLDAQARLAEEFRALEIDPNSEIARSVARIGAQMSQEQRRFVPPAEAFEAWKQMMAPMFGAQTAAPTGQQPGVTPPVPPVPPPGRAATTDMRPTDPAERGRARLDAFLRGGNG